MDNLNLAIQAYERSLRTISIGTCAPEPILELLPFLTQNFFGMAVSSETVPPDTLLPALENKPSPFTASARNSKIPIDILF